MKLKHIESIVRYYLCMGQISARSIVYSTTPYIFIA